MYRPTSRRYLLRTLVQCGECGLRMVCIRQRSGKKYEYLYYACKGYSPLSVGRTTKCHAKLSVRADRLDTLVWHAPRAIAPPAECDPTTASNVGGGQTTQPLWIEAHAQLLQRRQRLSVRTNVYSMPIRPRFSTCRSCKHGGRNSLRSCTRLPRKAALSSHAATEHPLATRHGQHAPFANYWARILPSSRLKNVRPLPNA